MPDVMKTLLLNPPSFENFDGGASSRWPATREIESYWYPVWLSYPAGMIPGSRLLDASPHKVDWKQTIQICTDYDFLILYTSTDGFYSDVKLIRKIKEENHGLKIAIVGPHVAADDFGTRVADAQRGQRSARSEEHAGILPADERDFLRRRYVQHPARPSDRAEPEVQAAEVPVVLHGAVPQQV